MWTDKAPRIALAHMWTLSSEDADAAEALEAMFDEKCDGIMRTWEEVPGDEYSVQRDDTTLGMRRTSWC